MKQHTKILKKFLANIGLAGVRVRNNNVSESDIANSIIYYNPQGEQDLDSIMKKIYAKKKHDIKVSMTTYAFFHELGHVLSKQELDDIDKEMKAYAQHIHILALLYTDEEELMIKYRELKLEQLADKYAYEVYKKYENLAIKLDKKLQALQSPDK
jgi:hypothetical protein